MRWTCMAVGFLMAGAPATAVGQEVIEVPVRAEGGRLVVQLTDGSGGSHDFILGLATGVITTSAAARLADRELSLGGIPIPIDQHQRVPDDYLTRDGPTRAVGVLGGQVLTDYDVLIDASAGRMLLKPFGRSVRWPGHSLTNPVTVDVLHDFLIRAKVQIGESVYDALLDLSPPVVQLSPPIADEEGVRDGPIDTFRMGYAGWKGIPAWVGLTPTMQGWGGAERGFVVVGAPIAADCVLAISWRHREIRTCIR